MKVRYSMIALGLLLVPLAGTATAGNGLDESIVWIDLRAAGGPLLYFGDDGGIWEESNAFDGLQMGYAPVGRGVVKEPDSQLA